MTTTLIDWATATWQPIIGCSPISAGCVNCYAAREASSGRLARFPQYQGLATGGKWTGQIRLRPKVLGEPIGWKTPQRVFVCPRADVFHTDVPFGFVMRMLSIMAYTPRHSYLILTKRPERMLEFFERWACIHGESLRRTHPRARGPSAVRKQHPSPRGELFAQMLESMGPPPESENFPSFDWAEGMLWWRDVFQNIWLGVSVEDCRSEATRLFWLDRTRCVHRFVSYEPALEAVDWSKWLGAFSIDWLIVGGESGPGARPCKVEWIDAAVAACKTHHVPVYVKQTGQILAKSLGLKSRKGSKPHEWPADLRKRWPRQLPEGLT